MVVVVVVVVVNMPPLHAKGSPLPLPVLLRLILPPTDDDAFSASLVAHILQSPPSVVLNFIGGTQYGGLEELAACVVAQGENWVGDGTREGRVVRIEDGHLGRPGRLLGQQAHEGP